MTDGSLQLQLFNAIKVKIADNLNAVDEIAKVLNISADSAYRRMRGEKTISLDELYLLCSHYRLSLDQLMNVPTDNIIFQGSYFDRKSFSFEQYLKGVQHTLAYYNNFKEKEFFYMCKDLPIFHHFHFREVAAFKWYFWMKSYFQAPGFAKKKFRFTDYTDELFAIDQKILELYNQLPSVEVWNIESMSILLRQIEFCRDADVFESDADAFLLYEQIEKLWDHLEKQASMGYKIKQDDPEQKPMASFKMYFNEILLGDNSMLTILDGVKTSIILHATINYMSTRDMKFCENH
ncbi:MAG TPA: hypothetical protein VLJ68_01915, partial [Chitinophagaceae bacterium]|nr:hypothetical protein [Chitinophagaceae bacterium]